MEKRDFLKNTAAAVISCSLFPGKAIGSFASKSLSSIGIQLFSLPKLLEKDFRGGIEMLSKMGYKEVELYGPFPFSDNSVKEGWKAITPNLGFSGSGYFGHTPKEIKSILTDNGIRATAIHTDMVTLQTNMEEIAEASNILGFDYAGIPAIPQEKRMTLDGYKSVAEEFNKIGEQAKKMGLKFSYHNHGYGLQEMDGEIPLNLILDQTDAGLVFFEMDIYWTTAGGADPIAYLEAYPNRYHLMHIKDMKEKVRFSGDGGGPNQWIELFPYMTTAGDGIFDLQSIVAAGKKAGVKHFFVEQDMVHQPEIALKKSIDYLKNL